MKQLNIFSDSSVWFPLRWFIIFGIGMMAWLSYADYTGWRLLTFNNQQKWSASGPGGHK